MVRPGPTPVDVEVGVRIRERRPAFGMTQRALAAALGITVQQLRRYEIGRTPVSAATLVRTAVTLRATVADLVGEVGGGVFEAIAGVKLNTPGASDLLAAYAGITERELREHLLGIAKGPGDGRRPTRLGEARRGRG
jgi:transcriptional regulator with XRE-family HTH domain